MGRRQGKQGARGISMKNADPPRVRSSRVAMLPGVGSDAAQEVPSEVVSVRMMGKKKGRKDLMSVTNEKRSGVTSIGCPIGSLGTIVYTLSEKEEALLLSMGQEVAENDGEMDDYLMGNFMYNIFIQ